MLSKSNSKQSILKGLQPNVRILYNFSHMLPSKNNGTGMISSHNISPAKTQDQLNQENSR
jgi:hypothetical protein